MRSRRREAWPEFCRDAESNHRLIGNCTVNPILAFTVAVSLSILVSGYAVAQDAERDAKLAELDALCEAARQRKIAVERAKAIEECVAQKQRSDRAACERFYADFGARVGGRPPLFYDLPECVAAHEFRTSYRSSNR